jgi:hypothetical protein
MLTGIHWQQRQRLGLKMSSKLGYGVGGLTRRRQASLHPVAVSSTYREMNEKMMYEEIARQMNKKSIFW